MKITKEIIIKSIDSLQDSTSNKFWGLLAIFSSVKNQNEKIDNNLTYKVETHLISKKLENLFYFGTDIKVFGENSLYFHLSKNWKELFNEIILKTKPNILDTAIFFFKNEEFDSVNSKVLVNMFIDIINLPLDMIEIIFDLNYNDYEIPLEKDYPKTDLLDLIKQNFNLNLNHSTFSFESPYLIASHPGELKRASFTQTLYSGSKIQEVILVTDFNLDESYFISNKNSTKDGLNSILTKSKNIIYYGAPGTGKSHTIKEIVKGKGDFTERVTFHPEYDYTSFVGGYKPTSKNGDIKYEFVPQIFTNIYVKAWNDLENNEHYLVIEEINRGNCAEIFGDIFQLLDRNPEYLITPSDELIDYLQKNLKGEGLQGIESGKMRLPNNLTILASMNTSDQSLFPMDSAFKRRWDWEYVPICYKQEDEEGEDNPSYNYIIDIDEKNSFKWIDFIEKININHIMDNDSLGMDKCLGNYFIKPDLKENCISLKSFINKAIFYLWNDVFKDEENKVFEEKTSYEDFFPIQTKGKEKIKELFERIDLKKIPNPKMYQEETVLDMVAEPEVQSES